MMSFSQIINDFIQSFSSINLGGNFKEIVTNPLTILTLIGVLIILVLLIKAKDIKFDAKMLTTIGIALALTAVLNMLKIYKFPQGGGITLGSMIPIILIAYAYGPLVGMLTGFLFGIISLFIDPYILHPVQVLFDYPIPYMALENQDSLKIIEFRSCSSNILKIFSSLYFRSCFLRILCS